MERQGRTALLAGLAVMLALSIPAGADWQTSSVGVGNYVAQVAVDPVRNRIFTANLSDGTVTVVDGMTNQTQTWATVYTAWCLAVNPVTGKLYVGVHYPGSRDTVLVFDTLGAVVGKLPVKDEPWNLALDLDSNQLFVANKGSDTVSLFKHDIFRANIAVKDGPVMMAVNPVNRFLYLTYLSSDTVTCINMDEFYNNYLVVSGSGACGLAVCASVNKVYVANRDADSVTVIDGATNYISNKIPVYDDPRQVVCDPSAKRAYVASLSGSAVTAINCSTGAVIGSFTGIQYANHMAINPITKKLYVASNNSSMLTVIDWRGTPKRDSLPLGHLGGPLALNPLTNRVYVNQDCAGDDSLAVIDGADYDTAFVTAGTNTYGAVVNPITYDAFFTNSGSDNVTLVWPDNSTYTIPVGNDPRALALNPLTNKLFVCNYADATVSVIDAYDLTVERTIPVFSEPAGIAVNPLTNHVYVTSFVAGFDRIKVIDCSDWDTTSIQVGNKPFSVAVNQATNRIYVGNDVSDNVTVIDGASHTVMATIGGINRPYKIEANPQTNKVYVAKLQTSGQVAVIDGASNTVTATVAVGNWPSGLAINRAVNKIYVTNANSNTVTEIDGATNATSTIAVGTFPEWIAADPVAGKVFVSNSNGSSLSIIDCAGRGVKTITVPAGPRQVAVDPAAGKAYLACYTAGRAVVLDQSLNQPTGVGTDDLTPDPWSYVTLGPVQNRELTSGTTWTPHHTRISQGMFTLANQGSHWKMGGNYSYSGSTLNWETGGNWGADTAFYGENLLLRGCLEPHASATNNLGQGTPFVSDILGGLLYRVDYDYPAVAWWDSLPDDNDSANGYGPYQVRAVITDFSGIDSAMLGFTVIGSGSYNWTTMTRMPADTFRAEIPEQALAYGDTAIIAYYLQAVDHAYVPELGSNVGGAPDRAFRIRNLTGVGGQPNEPALPRAFALQPARPNPARGLASIQYQLPKTSLVTLEIYSITGQLVKRFDEGAKQPGHYSVKWNAAKHGAGVYFYRLRARLCQGSDGQAGEYQSTKKLVVIK